MGRCVQSQMRMTTSLSIACVRTMYQIRLGISRGSMSNKIPCDNCWHLQTKHRKFPFGCQYKVVLEKQWGSEEETCWCNRYVADNLKYMETKYNESR